MRTSQGESTNNSVERYNLITLSVDSLSGGPGLPLSEFSGAAATSVADMDAVKNADAGEDLSAMLQSVAEPGFILREAGRQELYLGGGRLGLFHCDNFII